MIEFQSSALVTGSSRGIGLAIADALARAGHHLLLCARDTARLEQAAAGLRKHGGKVVTVAADLRARNTVAAILDTVNAQLGAIDVLVNNAGTAPTAKIEATDDVLLDEVLDLHVRAPLALIRALLPGMRQRERGCLLQLGSTAGLRGYPFTTAYTAAKHAMVGMTRAIAAELQRSAIRAYVLCPGFVDSHITRGAAAAIAARGKTSADAAFAAMAAQNRIGRMHLPDEVAAAAVMLVRDRPAGCVYDLDRTPPAFVDP